MFPAKLAVLFTALCFSVFFNLVFINKVFGDAMPSSTSNCVTCLTCQFPCTPGGGYPLYPPPPPSQTLPQPPPPPQQPKCPPGQPSQYPTPPGQYPQSPTPPGTIGGGGGYVPYPYNQENSATSSPLSILLSVLVMLLFSSAVFF